MSKLQQIIEAHLPKEKELWTPKSFPAGKEGILDNETIGIALQNAREMRSNDYEIGFNACLAEIKKALPDIEKEIVNEILNVEPNCTDEHEYQDKILTSLTK